MSFPSVPELSQDWPLWSLWCYTPQINYRPCSQSLGIRCVCVCVSVCVCVHAHVCTLSPFSRVRLFVTPWTPCQASLSITKSWSLLKLMSIGSAMPFTHLILCCPLLLLPLIFPSIRVFSSGSVLHIMWPKYWSFSFSLSPSNEHRGLISFRINWLDLLVVQGTLWSLLQHHSSKASILRCWAFLIVQLLHP